MPPSIVKECIDISEKLDELKARIERLIEDRAILLNSLGLTEHEFNLHRTQLEVGGLKSLPEDAGSFVGTKIDEILDLLPHADCG